MWRYAADRRRRNNPVGSHPGRRGLAVSGVAIGAIQLFRVGRLDAMLMAPLQTFVLFKG
jgi:hypothetical protein